MSFKSTYETLINNAKSLNRSKGKGIYYESHHIIPKCLGGKDTKDNLVLLTAKEHYKAHKLLYLSEPDNNSLFKAWHMMAFPSTRTQDRDFPISSEDYSMLRSKSAKLMTDWNKEYWTEDNRKKQSNNRKEYFKDPENIEKVRESTKLRMSDPNEVKKISNSVSNFYDNNPEHKALLSKLAKERYKDPAYIETHKSGLKKRKQTFYSKNKRPIIQLTKDGKFIKEHTNFRDLKEFVINNIRLVAEGKRKTAHGYKWVWVENYNKDKEK